METDIVARSQVWLERTAGFVLGAQETRLLEAIERAGSIKDGAQAAGMSYRTAWARVRDMERALGRPIVRSRAGGPGGGSTTLTADAHRLVRVFHELDRRVAEALREAFPRALELAS
jgi:molybdate transport system regulatory protein